MFILGFMHITLFARELANIFLHGFDIYFISPRDTKSNYLHSSPAFIQTRLSSFQTVTVRQDITVSSTRPHPQQSIQSPSKISTTAAVRQCYNDTSRTKGQSTIVKEKPS